MCNVHYGYVVVFCSRFTDLLRWQMIHRAIGLKGFHTQCDVIKTARLQALIESKHERIQQCSIWITVTHWASRIVNLNDCHFGWPTANKMPIETNWPTSDGGDPSSTPNIAFTVFSVVVDLPESGYGTATSRWNYDVVITDTVTLNGSLLAFIALVGVLVFVAVFLTCYGRHCGCCEYRDVKTYVRYQPTGDVGGAGLGGCGGTRSDACPDIILSW